MAPDPDALRKRLKGLAAPALLDAVLARYGHAAHLPGLVSPTPGRVLFGQAVTLQYLPLRKDVRDPARHNFAARFYEALGQAPHGHKVLVLANGGRPDVSLGGGTKLSRAANHGLAGVLADGHLRDFHELADYKFAAYCRGETAMPGDGVLMPYAAGVPVHVGGVTVLPGDWVYADGHGGLVLPGEAVADLLEDAHRLEAEDQAWIKRIRAEDPATVLKEGSGEK